MDNKSGTNKKPGIITRLFSGMIQKSVSAQLNQHFNWNAYGALKGNKSAYMKGIKTAQAYAEEIYVYGCVFLISNTIASIPIRIYKDESKSEDMKNHPAYTLFKKPNFKDSMYDIKESISANLELDGNGYLLVNEGKPQQIFSLAAPMITIEPNKTAGITSMSDMIQHYKYGQKEYSVDEIIHERKFNINTSLKGLSPIRAAAMNIDTLAEARRQNYNMFVNGMNTNVVFESDADFDGDAYKRLKDDHMKKASSAENAHLPYILFSGLKYKAAGLAPKDIEYVKALQLTREDICGFIYQVPMILLGVLENSSYNNIKEAQKIFYEFCIIPRLVKNRELYQKLVDKYSMGGYVDFDLSGIAVLQEDELERIKKAKEMWGMGVSVKQLNDMYHLGIKPYPGWDIGYLPFSVMPAGTSREPEPSDNGDDNGGGEPAKTVRKEARSKEFWTEERKVAKWQQFDKISTKHENEYKRDLNAYFKQQQKEVIKNLNKYKSIGAAKVHDDTFIIYGEPHGIDQKKEAIRVDSVLFDKDDEVKRLTKVSAPIYKRAIIESATAELELLGIDIAFDINNPRIARWIEQVGLNKAKEVNATIIDKLRTTIIDGINEGESIVNLTDRIEQVYEGYTKYSGFDAERIARTETIGAANQGALESYKQADVEKKGWLSTRDGRVRDTHREAEDRYADGIPVDKNFNVGAGSGPAPGQMGVAEEDINCRCSLIGIVD